MSETSAKGVPLAAVVYVVRFDAKGRPLREAAFHIEMSGAVHLTGGPSMALEPLLAATRGCMKAVVGQTMREALEEHEERGLGSAVTRGDWPLGEAEPDGLGKSGSLGPLPAAGEIF